MSNVLGTQRVRRGGFAMITALLIMVVVVGLGSGAIFLTTLNLRIAENSRTHAIAKANANAGLEVAIATLFEAYERAEPNRFPASFDNDDVPVRAGNAGAYELITCDPSVWDDHLVRVCVRGFGPNGSEYTSEALIGMEPGNPNYNNDPKYAFGMISERSVGVAGASGSFIDAGLHSNGDLWLPGWSDDQFQYCTSDRDMNGYCPDANLSEYAQAEDMPLSVWEGGGRGCGPGQGPSAFCQGGRVKDEFVVADEVTVNVDYTERRHRAAGGTFDEEGNFQNDGLIAPDGSINVLDCAAATDATCFDSDADVLADAVNGQTIIANGDVNISCVTTCDLEDTVIISTGGTVTFDGIETATNTRIFSEHDLSIPNTQWYGASTLASAGSISFFGTAHTFEPPSGTSVGFSIIAEEDITTNGGGGTEMVGTFVAGGDFIWNGGGGVYVRGGVLIKGQIDVAGGYTIDSGLPTANPDLDQSTGTGAMEAQVISRR